jgi:hypothetical protein
VYIEEVSARAHEIHDLRLAAGQQEAVGRDLWRVDGLRKQADKLENELFSLISGEDLDYAREIISSSEEF